MRRYVRSLCKVSAMEIWDGYNKDGTLAGVDIIRGEPIPDGIYFIA